MVERIADEVSAAATEILAVLEDTWMWEVFRWAVGIGLWTVGLVLLVLWGVVIWIVTDK